jgi:hypothetical protein
MLEGQESDPKEGQHFFLSASGESIDLAEPRECWEINRLKCGVRDHYMLVSIEPPLEERHGIGYLDIYKVILATRFKGQTLYPVSAWPSHVSVMTYPAELGPADTEITPERVQVIAWAMLFRTREHAAAHFNKFC